MNESVLHLFNTCYCQGLCGILALVQLVSTLTSLSNPPLAGRLVLFLIILHLHVPAVKYASSLFIFPVSKESYRSILLQPRTSWKLQLLDVSLY